MRKLLLILPFLLVNSLTHAQNTQSEMIRSIYNEALTAGESYQNLKYLCKEIGPRLSGSPQAAAAVEYTFRLMQEYDFDTVFLQPVVVPRWKRGDVETVRITNSKTHGTIELSCTTIGNSIGTGQNGILANVIEVSGMEEVEELGKKLEGKIVFYNGPMDPTLLSTFRAYGNAVIQRAFGASEAAKYGAKAVIIRSMSNTINDIPHTGSLRYKPNMPRIPAMAISTEDAELLSELLKKEGDLNIFMETHCEMRGEVESYNVIGQLNGVEKGSEYIVVGGHLDSWDVGEGAHDDGSGCMQAIEALRILKDLGYQPKRNIRAVMWMNEENGLMGGREYAKQADINKEKHIAALESDRGGFSPRGFTMTGNDDQIGKVKKWKSLFEPYDLLSWDQPGGGADIGPLAPQGTLLIGLLPDSQRYFEYHHTPADVFETVNQRELELGAAAMSSMIYLLDSEGVE